MSSIALLLTLAEAIGRKHGIGQNAYFTDVQGIFGFREAVTVNGFTITHVSDETCPVHQNMVNIVGRGWVSIPEIGKLVEQKPYRTEYLGMEAFVPAMAFA